MKLKCKSGLLLIEIANMDAVRQEGLSAAQYHHRHHQHRQQKRVWKEICLLYFKFLDLGNSHYHIPRGSRREAVGSRANRQANERTKKGIKIDPSKLVNGIASSQAAGPIIESRVRESRVSSHLDWANVG